MLEAGRVLGGLVEAPENFEVRLAGIVVLKPLGKVVCVAGIVIVPVDTITKHSPFEAQEENPICMSRGFQ